MSEREALADFLCGHLGMHEIDTTERFTLVGSDARRGKLTLFDAEGPRDPGVLERVVLRVADLDEAVRRLPSTLETERRAPGLVTFEGPEGLGLGLAEVDGPGPDYDVDHVVITVPDPARTAAELERLGFDRDGDALRVADKSVRLDRGERSEGERPLLNHIALLVDSAGEVEREAEERGLEVEVVDAANTLAVFLWGPDRIKLEYVEHKPSFSLV